MASMAISSSSSIRAFPSPHHRPHSHFTLIKEGNEGEEYSLGINSLTTTPISEFIEKIDSDSSHYKHHSTPLHDSDKIQIKGSSRKGKSVAVLCNKCRPTNREKVSIVPLPSPNGIFRSIFKKSPKLSSDDGASTRDEQWKILVAELSNRLIQATRKRDESILEASKLKHSMSELEKKLNKLEIYCDNLKSGLEICSNVSNPKVGDQDKVIDHFLVSISESRSMVRILSKALVLQLRQMGPKVCDRISLLLNPYEIKISFSRNPKALLFYMEALLSKAFYEDFESIGFQKSAMSTILDPIHHCEGNFAMFSRLQGLNWEEVLNKGTRYFSEDFSKFCDRKMSEVVAMLGWNKAWPEPLLQAFFGASKSVWLVHLLANSVHPSLPIFRVDKGVEFDPVYMEDMGADMAKKLVPTTARIMVTPGFYVYDNVVKCKVLCRYYNNING